MKYVHLKLKSFQKLSQQVICTAVFILLLAPLFLTLSFIRTHMTIGFHLLAYFTGWLIWTFAEYMIHRFWQHGHHDKKEHNSIKLHQHHHAHPNQIKITAGHRVLLAIICIAMIGLSILFNNFFSILTGVVLGFTWYSLIHWSLHRRWSAFVFPRLHRFHIYHHCKYPNLCHGISVAWWDMLFRTTPPKDKMVTERIQIFYYGK